MPDEPGRTILDNIVSARRRTLEETRLALPPERVQQMAEARAGAPRFCRRPCFRR